MADLTAIEWCDATLSLWWGCTKVSEGCKFCYAEDLADGKLGRSNWGPKGKRQEVKSWRSELNKISNRGLAEGRRMRVFCQSMSDTFEGPETCGGVNSGNWQLMSRLRQEMLELIPQYPHLDFLLLTKRPENVCKFLSDSYEIRVSGTAGYDDSRTELCLPKNLWLGTSVEDQATADERIPILTKIPAAVRFLSCEPLIGKASLEKWAVVANSCRYLSTTWPNESGKPRGPVLCLGHPKCECQATHNAIHWVIAGGESGPNARPMHPSWVRSLRDQCVAANVPFFFKQWGEWLPYSQGGRTFIEDSHEWGTMSYDGEFFPSATTWSGRQEDGPNKESTVHRVGKKEAGRLLDGREWNEFPEYKYVYY